MVTHVMNARIQIDQDFAGNAGKRNTKPKTARKTPGVLYRKLNLGSKDTEHVPGSGTCIVFQQVLDRRRKNQK